MRQELTAPNPQQKFPDRLGGDHASVTLSATERREFITGIAVEAYIAMGYPLRENEREEVAAVWCKAFDGIPDTELESVRAEGFQRQARTPMEYVAIFDEWAVVRAREAHTKRVLAQIEADKRNAVPAGVESPGKAYAMEVWRNAGILKPETVPAA
jgi:hypothetical protein